jgi:hypothetical protein
MMAKSLDYKMAALILYEDQQLPVREFGLHKFVMSCAYDAVNGAWQVLELAVEGRPLKGNAKLLKCIKEDFARLASNGRHVIAVFDNDKIRTLLRLPKTSPDSDVVTCVREHCSRDEQALTVILIHQNTESILQATGECATKNGREFDSDQLDKAVVQKVLFARDAFLVRFSAAQFKDVRDCVLDTLPSFASLVNRLIQFLPAELGAASH